jgi:O-antigen/teichoic acid export membrane protein
VNYRKVRIPMKILFKQWIRVVDKQCLPSVNQPMSSEASRVPVSHRKAVLVGSIWVFAVASINRIAALLALLVLAQLLSPEDYGLANVGISLGAALIALPPYAMTDVLLARPKEFDRNAPAAQLVSAGAGLLLAILITTLGLTAPYWSNRAGLPLILALVALRPVFDALMVVPMSKLRVDLRFRRLAAMDGGSNLLLTAVGVAMAWIGFGAASLVFPPIAAIGVRSALYWSSFQGQMWALPSKNEVLSILRRFLAAALGQYLGNVLMMAEGLVLSAMATTAGQGYFALAYQLASQANAVVIGQLGAVIQPVLSKLNGEPERQFEAYLRSLRTMALIAIPIFVVQATLAAPVMRLAFATKWGFAIAPLAVLSFAQIGAFTAIPSMALLKAQGRFRVLLLWQGSQLVISLVAFVIAGKWTKTSAAEFAQHFGYPVNEDSSAAVAISLASLAIWTIVAPFGLIICSGLHRNRITRTLLCLGVPLACSTPVAILLAKFALLMESAQSLSGLLILGCILGAGVLGIALGSLGSLLCFTLSNKLLKLQ